MRWFPLALFFGASVAIAQNTSTPAVAPGAQGVNVGQAKTEDVFEESVVTASKAAQSPLDAPNSTSIITEQDIRLSGLIQIPDLLRRLAGVDVMETTNSQTEVSIRGFGQVQGDAAARLRALFPRRIPYVFAVF